MRANSKTLRKMLPVSSIFFCSLALLFVLSACDTGSTPAKSSSTPTTQPATPTPAMALTTYQGKNYVIGYPATWKAVNQDNLTSLSGGEQVALNEEPGGVIVQDIPNKTNVSADKYLSVLMTALKSSIIKDAKPTGSPTTTQVANETWTEQTDTGNIDSSGVKGPGKFTCLTINHTANTRLYSICLIGLTGGQGADKNLDSEFQAMLKSFQFK